MSGFTPEKMIQFNTLLQQRLRGVLAEVGTDAEHISLLATFVMEDGSHQVAYLVDVPE